MTSPFAAAFEQHMGQVPLCFMDQYLPSGGGSSTVILAGKMERVWHRPFWLWLPLWVLSRGDILFPEQGRDIATTLRITTSINEQGCATQRWERAFHFPGRNRRFCSTMVYDPASNCVIELEGSRDQLEEYTRVIFEPPCTVRFISEKSILRIGGLRIKLPSLFWPTARVEQVVQDATSGTTRVTLVLTSRILGPIFGYTGIFKQAVRDAA